MNISANPPRVLAIAPHHDDEVIGCGGTLLHLIDQGYSVSVIHVFNGSSGTSLPAEESKIIRSKEAKDAAKLAGWNVIDSLNFDDRKDNDVTDIIHRLIPVFRDFQPGLIFFPHANEQDYEHQVVSKSTWEACWLSGTSNYPEHGKPTNTISTLLGYEVWRPIKHVAVHVDITKYSDKKRTLIEAFTSQVKTTSWVEGALGLSAYRGTVLQGYGYAEAFTIKDLHSLTIERAK